MTPLFQRAAGQKEQSNHGRESAGPRVPRHSSAWMKILTRLKAEPGLCVLDIGPTSPNNINFLTNLGHSVYMADLVEEAVKADWLLPTEEGEPPAYDVEGFLVRHMDFGNREFDVVLLWDALDYIPAPFADAILRRLKAVMRERGQAIAFFHSKMKGPETTFCRYHVMDGDTVETQQGPSHPVLRNYQNRQIEALFQEMGACRFLLAKDNTREVIVTL
ncbi:MAG TPA: methyltransferase domain-containing protein [Acidobacteriaceae bacterium]|nr:methyltransferase domain-containing protein [Acidobacteriaceae bacterium]